MEPGQQPLVVAVRISPAAGWAGDDAHTYAVSMLAVLCGMGFVAASLLFGALVSWCVCVGCARRNAGAVCGDRVRMCMCVRSRVLGNSS